MKLRVALLATSLLSPFGASAATLTEVLSVLPGDEVVTGDTATISGMRVQAGAATWIFDKVLAKQEGASDVVLSAPGDVIIEMNGDDEKRRRRLVLTAPESVMRISDVNGLSVSGGILVPEAKVVSQAEDHQASALLGDGRGVFMWDGDLSGKSEGTIIYQSAVIEMPGKSNSVRLEIDQLSTRWSQTNPAQSLSSYATIQDQMADGREEDAVVTANQTRFTVAADKPKSEVSGTVPPWEWHYAGDSQSMRIALKGEAGTAVKGPGDGGFQMGAYDMSVKLPSTADARRFSITGGLTQLVPDELGWASVDPKGALIHDPFSASISISGDLSEGFMMSSLNGAPSKAAPVKSLTVEDLRVSGLGSMLTADGNMSVNEKTGEPGKGKFNIKLVGVDQLLDGLLKAGVLSRSQVTMARASVAMFTTAMREGVSLTEIEFDGEKLKLNGQRIR